MRHLCLFECRVHFLAMIAIGALILSQLKYLRVALFMLNSDSYSSSNKNAFSCIIVRNGCFVAVRLYIGNHYIIKADQANNRKLNIE